eukprot:8392775-Ditylum_brightwellii.AAC.1
MKDFLQAEMEVEQMDDELLEFWEKLNLEDEGDLAGELVAGDVAPDLVVLRDNRNAKSSADGC